MTPSDRDAPRRWVVPRPGPDGNPLGVLRIEVVPAESYDLLEREAVKLRAQVRVLCDALNGVQAAVFPAAEVAAIYREVNR